VRLQGVFVSDAEIQRLVSYWQAFAGVALPASPVLSSAPDTLPAGIPLKQMPLWEEAESEESLDPLYNEAVDLARRQGRASISMLQRRLRIGYTRAARLIETMEEKALSARRMPSLASVKSWITDRPPLPSKNPEALSTTGSLCSHHGSTLSLAIYCAVSGCC
jgi:S-DNA-T family DNA segregation ATPase FtsK/SpoIIIE